MRPRRGSIRVRPITVLAVSAAAALLPLTTGCSAVEKALDCGRFAADITTDAAQFSDAMASAGDNPQGALDALDELDRDVDKLGDNTDDADVQKAGDRLGDQITEMRDALNDGRVPSAAPVVDAAGEVAKACTP